VKTITTCEERATKLDERSMWNVTCKITWNHPSKEPSKREEELMG